MRLELRLMFYEAESILPRLWGGEGNQSCSIAKCSLQHGNIKYCFQCENYPCEKYDNIDEFDSFITHQIKNRI